MKAVKGNRVYTITEAERESRRVNGFDIYDDDGKLIAYSKGKTVPYEQYAELEAENKKLTAENKKLQKELKELKKE